MKDETKVIGDCAVTRLDKLIADIEADTAAVVQTNDIPATVTHYAYVRELYDSLKQRLDEFNRHTDSLSRQILPTMFANQGVKTISLPEIGRVTVNVRWSASTINMHKAMDWMRQTGNSGMVIETINSRTLTTFAKAEALAGRPLPEELFKVGTSQYTSITNEGRDE